MYLSYDELTPFTLKIMGNGMEKMDKNVIRNNSEALIEVKEGFPDTLGFWLEAYFRFEVTTSESSQKVQQRDLKRFFDFMIGTEGSAERKLWSPRLSKAFKDHLKNMLKEDGGRLLNDRTINRILANLKTFAKWVHKLRPFPLGNPTEKLKLLPVGSALEVERAITRSERRRILDAADLLLVEGGRKKARPRQKRGFQKVEEILKDMDPARRPRRKGYRACRNRAIIYTLIETGMRRQAVTLINLDDVDFKKRTIAVEEKGGVRHRYQISKEGLAAIRDYMEAERPKDHDKWKLPALFLTPETNVRGNGRLSAQMINSIWKDVCEVAGVTGKTPHSARHAMGRHIIEKTGNVAAVQRQLGHKNAAYSMQYARITREELQAVLDDRG